jgi:hypothetical protein
MTQAIDIIRDALEYIRVSDGSAALDNSDVASALRTLNAMVRAWEADGLALGWSDITDATDDMPTPEEADEAIASNLAVRLASKYGANVTQILAAMASGGVALIRAMVARNDYARLSYDDLPSGESQRTGNPRGVFGF